MQEHFVRADWGEGINVKLVWVCAPVGHRLNQIHGAVITPETIAVVHHALLRKLIMNV